MSKRPSIVAASNDVESQSQQQQQSSSLHLLAAAALHEANMSSPGSPTASRTTVYLRPAPSLNAHSATTNNSSSNGYSSMVDTSTTSVSNATLPLHDASGASTGSSIPMNTPPTLSGASSIASEKAGLLLLSSDPPTKSSSSSSSSSSSLLIYQQQIHHFKTGLVAWCDKFFIIVAIAAWYIVGVLAIVTTKIQLQDWKCPPLVLTVQQMLLGTLILRFVITTRDGKLQPCPWEVNTASTNGAVVGASAAASTAISNMTTSTVALPSSNSGFASEQAQSTNQSSSNGNNNMTTSIELDHNSNGNVEFHSQPSSLYERLSRLFPWLRHPNFVLAGVFNALDFVNSNIAFSFSSAHFVETIKASEPITTTAIALLWKVDRLSTSEASSLAMLVAGVLLSTWGNSTDQQTSTTDERKLLESIETAILILSANIFFAFRAINQKRYRSLTHETQQMDDINFLCRMCQVGATFLMGPTVLIHAVDIVGRVMRAPREAQTAYVGLALVNAVSYVTYNLASCYVLSKLTVLHHSSLNCLRRMVAILATSIFFRKALSFEATVGLMTSFFGFASFTYHRNMRLRSPAAAAAKDSNV